MDCNKDVLRTSIGRLFATATIVAGAYFMLAATPAEAANPHASFGIGQPKMIDELPPGQLRDKISSLPQHARARALRNLQGFSFPGNDVAHIHADPRGGVFYVDPPAGNTTSDAGSEVFVPESSELSQADVFNLHSKVGASRTVYLDMDGHVVTGTAWNSSSQYSTLYMLPFSQDSDYTTFTAAELDVIAEVWKRVAEDFAPYDIDVTTAEPASFGPETGHILVSPVLDQYGNGIFSDGAGGVAYVNVWGASNFAYYQPALVFPENLGYSPHNIAEAASHELGHNLGLSHDGNSATGYYSGHGSGATNWAPIMGAGYYANVTQWSKGEYVDANNSQDDLQIIGSKLTYRNDDHEDVNFAGATPLVRTDATTIEATTPVSDPGNLIPYNKGVIEDRYDRDLFYLDVSGGVIDLTITPAWLESFSASSRRGMNIDILATLYDAYGFIVDDNPIDETNAVITANVPPGRYYLAIEGTGFGSPPADGYSDYGSLGQYFISGTVPANFTYSEPTAPGNVTAELFGDASIILEWTDPESTPATNEANYRVYREKDGGSAEHIATLPSDSTSYDDNNLPSGSYVYYLEAVNGAGFAPSNVTDPPVVVVIDVPSTAVATSEATSMGLVSSGSYVDTTVQTGFESLSELHQGGKPSKRVSRLEHVWTITGVQPAAMVQLELVAEAPGNDENDDFNLYYSLDLGDTYTSIGSVENGSGKQPLSATLPIDTTGTVLVKVVDTDTSVGNSSADVFNMHYLAVASNGSPEEQPPTVTITEPAEGGSYDVGAQVSLTAEGVDFEDGDISSSITWSCDRDGVLGTGASTTVVPETPGEHLITASVIDSASKQANDSVTITVIDPNAPELFPYMNDNSIAVRNKWNAVVLIVVQDNAFDPVEGVTVDGAWSNGTTGTGTCVTGGNGSCEITQNNLKSTVSSVTFQLTGLTHAVMGDSGTGDRLLVLTPPQ